MLLPASTNVALSTTPCSPALYICRLQPPSVACLALYLLFCPSARPVHLPPASLLLGHFGCNLQLSAQLPLSCKVILPCSKQPDPAASAPPNPSPSCRSQTLLLLSASSLHCLSLALLFDVLFSLEGLHLAGWQAHGGRGREQRQVIPTQPQAANLEPELAEGKRSWFGAFVSTLLYLKGAALQRPARRRAGYRHCSGVSRCCRPGNRQLA